jgi:hypothetical protein
MKTTYRNREYLVIASLGEIFQSGRELRVSHRYECVSWRRFGVDGELMGIMSMAFRGRNFAQRFVLRSGFAYHIVEPFSAWRIILDDDVLLFVVPLFGYLSASVVV